MHDTLRKLVLLNLFSAAEYPQSLLHPYSLLMTASIRLILLLPSSILFLASQLLLGDFFAGGQNVQYIFNFTTSVWPHRNCWAEVTQRNHPRRRISCRCFLSVIILFVSYSTSPLPLFLELLVGSVHDSAPFLSPTFLFSQYFSSYLILPLSYFT